jgi:hypothetical protein
MFWIELEGAGIVVRLHRGLKRFDSGYVGLTEEVVAHLLSRDAAILDPNEIPYTSRDEYALLDLTQRGASHVHPQEHIANYLRLRRRGSELAREHDLRLPVFADVVIDGDGGLPSTKCLKVPFDVIDDLIGAELGDENVADYNHRTIRFRSDFVGHSPVHWNFATGGSIYHSSIEFDDISMAVAASVDLQCVSDTKRGGFSSAEFSASRSTGDPLLVLSMKREEMREVFG